MTHIPRACFPTQKRANPFAVKPEHATVCCYQKDFSSLKPNDVSLASNCLGHNFTPTQRHKSKSEQGHNPRPLGLQQLRKQRRAPPAHEPQVLQPKQHHRTRKAPVPEHQSVRARVREGVLQQTWAGTRRLRRAAGRAFRAEQRHRPDNSASQTPTDEREVRPRPPVLRHSECCSGQTH